MADGSFHGGAWRLGFKFTSVGVPSALAWFATSFYLTAYNAVQAVGWTFMLLMAISCYFGGGDVLSNSATTWSVVGPSLTIFQNLALLEVGHSLLGLVSSPWHSTLLQIASRVFVVALYNWLPSIANSSAIYTLAVAWGITEITRYSWYALNIWNANPKLFTWFRYSTFLVLYPIGVFGELLSIWHALPSLAKGKYPTGGAMPYFVEHILMPACGFLNVQPDVLMQYLVFPLYGVGLVFLYTYMLNQRSKALKKLTKK